MTIQNKIQELRISIEKQQMFISDDTIQTAKEMDAYEKVKLGFVMDGIHYHIVKYCTAKKGFWVMKIKESEVTKL